MFPRPTIAANDVPLTTTEGHEDREEVEALVDETPTYDYRPLLTVRKKKVKVTDLVDGVPAVLTYPEEVFNYDRERLVGWSGEVIRDISSGYSSEFGEAGSVRIGSIDLPFRKSKEGYVLTTDVLLEQIAELVNKEIDDKVRAAFEEGFAAASVPVLAEGQL